MPKPAIAVEARKETVVALAEQAVPRYTSYPTAPHFRTDVGAEVYGRWLGALAPETTLSFYLHVPFCREMCWYCGCHTKIASRREPVEAYKGRLLREIALVAERTPARAVRHLHWGGGTPTMLGIDGIAEVVSTLGAHFDMTALTEHAIELDPRTLEPQDAAKLAALGVTRASLGVQDLNDHVQKAMGRVQPLDLVRRTVEALRAAGIDAINFDLMYGLPNQTDDDVRRTVDLALELAPDRVAVFGYAHVPWFKSHQKLIDTEALPDAPARLAQAAVAREAFLAHGYEAVGLDHFARPDDELAVAARWSRIQRNFQGYTTDEADALIGLGASAIGRLPQGYIQNAPDFGAYYRAIDAGTLATVRGFALTDDDRLRAALIERVMCEGAVDVDAVAASLGATGAAFDGDIAKLAPLAEKGLVQVDGRQVRVTREGQPLVRLVAAAFDAYMSPAGRHAAAV